MYKHILISTDGSDVAQKGVEQGLALAKATGARVTLITVTEAFPIYATAGAGWVSTEMANYDEIQKEHAERILARTKETADKLFGDDYRWSVLGAGRHQMPLITQAAMMGGNVRVGLEDNLYIGAGQLARSNAEQVAKIRRIIEELGLAIATPDEAREILALKGGDKVGF